METAVAMRKTNGVKTTVIEDFKNKLLSAKDAWWLRYKIQTAIQYSYPSQYFLVDTHNHQSLPQQQITLTDNIAH